MKLGYEVQVLVEDYTLDERNERRREGSKAHETPRTCSRVPQHSAPLINHVSATPSALGIAAYQIPIAIMHRNHPHLFDKPEIWRFTGGRPAEGLEANGGLVPTEVLYKHPPRRAGLITLEKTPEDWEMEANQLQDGGRHTGAKVKAEEAAANFASP
ncbi:uncharacterized protein Z520_11725 [Fonsecaea multimorphosa CBS 102226]|uniref:Uncharacterized protein n=1 Tax=Fonsecaea multimorphosa CBS 102226 TaxID=1442371 RepID=A0A0D2JPX3_9EURO|nr:uncharacterized protein Z520_11725 [Fonsecaea multimorphosa CBS 102226]KIX92549.1 hypothetical protein Z520_11725 [Fonsecaea multimorphosa CBS 102226]OAL17817.1 hypothetical protein AYO22_11244 [Fonsecaea multimorphosa]